MSVGELPIHKRLYLYLAGRSEGDGDYRVSIEIRPNGEVWVLPIARPGYYILLSPRINTGLVIAPGDTFNVELSITGQSTATIKGRVWAADQVRPDWQFSETDSSVVLMDSGGVGFTGDVQRPSPRPIAVTIDNLVVYEG